MTDKSTPNIVYDNTQTPMQNLLNSTLSEPDKLAIHEFAQKHGIAPDESLWSQMLLQLGLLRQHMQLADQLKQLNQTVLKDIEITVDAGIKKLIEVGNTLSQNAAEEAKVEIDKQVGTAKITIESFSRNAISELREGIKVASKETLSDGANGLFKELNYTLSQLKEMKMSLIQAGRNAEKNNRTDLMKIFIFSGIASFTSLVLFFLIGRTIFQWF